jgi:glycosyltransferase involved in cell wall biosynthesis
MKVSLVLNAYIGPTVNVGPGAEGYQLALDLYGRGVLGKVYCYGVEPGICLPHSVLVPFCTSRIHSTALRLLSRLTKRYPILRGRRRIEQWMDKRYSKLLDNSAGDILYSPKPLYPLTFSKARRLGIRVAVETSVLHPRFNLDVVTNERKRLKLRGAAGYTDPVRVKYIEEALEQADSIFAWSPFIRDSYVRYGVEENKLLSGTNKYEPPGVDLKRFCPVKAGREDHFVVLHMSSITVIKGVQFLLDAWQKVANRIAGELVLVGQIDRDMRKILGRYKCQNVKWTGPTNNPVSYYHMASIFVSPSLSDAGPRTVLESMACGVPAIVSDHCGISSSIETGYNGFVYHYNDVDRLAELIEWCYRNRDQVQKMGQVALDTIKGYSVANYSDDVWTRINAVVKE